MNDYPDRNLFSVKFGLIGHPVSQSLSPSLFKYIFHEFNLEAEYIARDVAPHELQSFMNDCCSSDLSGFNVTIPHKSAAISFLDDIDPVAACIGAVNCIRALQGRLKGYNTDQEGIRFSLSTIKSFESNSDVLILGAGGAARAAVYALLRYFNPENIFICNRSVKTAANVINDFSKHFPEKKLTHISPDRLRNIHFKGIINCLPPEYFSNFANQNLMIFKSIRWLFDINYYPPKKIISDNTSRSDLDYMSGLTMLAVQAMESFKIWTGIEMQPGKAIEFLEKSCSE